jgi:polar amino acid transport system permease protein
VTWLLDQFSILSRIFYYLIQTVHWTILISVLSYLIALTFGLVFGIARLSQNKPVRWIAGAYVNVLRGVPLLVLIFFFYFGLGKVVNLDRFVAGANTKLPCHLV